MFINIILGAILWAVVDIVRAKMSKEKINYTELVVAMYFMILYEVLHDDIFGDDGGIFNNIKFFIGK
jgi:hypothetical protein